MGTKGTASTQDNTVERVNVEDTILQQNKSMTTTTLIPTSNRFQILREEDIFTLDRCTTGSTSDHTHAYAHVDARVDAEHVRVNFPIETVANMKQVRQAHYHKNYNKETLKNLIRDSRRQAAKEKLANSKHGVTVKHLAHLKPEGTDVLHLCKTKMIQDRKVKRMLLLWMLNKFNRPDIQCK